MSFKKEVAQVLQNLSGKTVETTGKTFSEMLRGFNLQYTCIVTFALTPDNATIVLKKGTTIIAPEEEDGTYALKEGVYTYDAIAPGYTSKLAQSLTITNSEETTGTKTVTVALATCVVTFTKTPSDLSLVVKKGTTIINAEQDGTYLLPADTYSYSASADGYDSVEDVELVISSGDQTNGTKTVAVTLSETQG